MPKTKSKATGESRVIKPRSKEGIHALQITRKLRAAIARLSKTEDSQRVARRNARKELTRQLRDLRDTIDRIYPRAPRIPKIPLGLAVDWITGKRKLGPLVRSRQETAYALWLRRVFVYEQHNIEDSIARAIREYRRMHGKLPPVAWSLYVAEVVQHIARDPAFVLGESALQAKKIQDAKMNPDGSVTLRMTDGGETTVGEP